MVRVTICTYPNNPPPRNSSFPCVNTWAGRNLPKVVLTKHIKMRHNLLSCEISPVALRGQHRIQNHRHPSMFLRQATGVSHCRHPLRPVLQTDHQRRRNQRCMNAKSVANSFPGMFFHKHTFSDFLMFHCCSPSGLRTHMNTHNNVKRGHLLIFLSCSVDQNRI